MPRLSKFFVVHCPTIYLYFGAFLVSLLTISPCVGWNTAALRGPLSSPEKFGERPRAGSMTAAAGPTCTQCCVEEAEPGYEPQLINTAKARAHPCARACPHTAFSPFVTFRAPSLAIHRAAALTPSWTVWRLSVACCMKAPSLVSRLAGRPWGLT